MPASIAVTSHGAHNDAEIRRLRATAVRLALNAVPKICGCGRKHDGRSWSTLEFVAFVDDAGEVFEMRTCICRSTLAVEVPR